MKVSIKAMVKDIQAKPGVAVVKLEVLPTAEGFLDLFPMIGQAA